MKSQKKIQWQGGILNSNTDLPVTIKGEKKTPSPSSTSPQKITGNASIRTEKKGRAGNPVLIIFKFSDEKAKKSANLKELCSGLKSKLACGGTVENGEIIMIYRDVNQLKIILSKFFEINIS